LKGLNAGFREHGDLPVLKGLKVKPAADMKNQQT
jgi:hypothetical protein